MISHKLKFIFIHIPKTSGNSLSVFLTDFVNNTVTIRDSPAGKDCNVSIICEKRSQKQIKHANIDYYKRLYGKQINDYFKFTIVRNPYDRILSYYFYQKCNLQEKNYETFNRDEFINFVKENKQILNQYTYIDNSFHIVYFENLIDDLKNLDCFKGVIDFNNYPKLNSSYNSKIDFETIYDKELKDLVFNKFKKDFDIFGYNF
tara:strand:+ start:683 stop:1291 length:609 start_codon:yes stop_codon:yes gene_type:complete